MSRHVPLLAVLLALPAGAQSEIATFHGAAPGDRHAIVVGGEDLDGGGREDLVVGAPEDDTAGNNAGAVYAYSGETGALIWAQYGSTLADTFGRALALTQDLDGDFVKDVVVGAPNAELSTNVRPGQVQVLSGVDGSVLYVRWGDDNNEGMGWSVAGAFEWGGGNKCDFAGGAPYDDDGGSNAGSFRVWSGNDGALLATVSGAAGDNLGSSMSGVLDVNNDTSLDLAVGAPFADFVNVDVGRVRVYDNGVEIWTKTGFVTGDAMGWAVAPAGDLNGDNFDDVLVGEPGNIDNGPEAGRVRAFNGSNGFQLDVLRGDGAGDRFGSSLAFVFDLDGDGRVDWVVGAPQPGTGAGYARVFSSASGNELFTLSGDAVGDEFGDSVSGAGLTFGNKPALAVGARNHDGPAGLDTGMVRHYTGNCPGIVSYCTAGISASGCQPVILAAGTPSATAPSGFAVSATSAEGGKDGLFFFGWSGRQAAQWGNGTSYQCVVPPVKRGGKLSKTGGHGTCTGDFYQDLNQLWFNAPAKNPGAGAVVQVQLWYRDPTNTSNRTTSLSNALEFVMCP